MDAQKAILDYEVYYSFTCSKESKRYFKNCFSVNKFYTIQ